MGFVQEQKKDYGLWDTRDKIFEFAKSSFASRASEAKGKSLVNEMISMGKEVEQKLHTYTEEYKDFDKARRVAADFSTYVDSSIADFRWAEFVLCSGFSLNEDTIITRMRELESRRYSGHHGVNNALAPISYGMGDFKDLIEAHRWDLDFSIDAVVESANLKSFKEWYDSTEHWWESPDA